MGNLLELSEAVANQPLVSYYGLTRAVPIVEELASYYLQYYGLGRDRRSRVTARPRSSWHAR
jgi:hypothetical protein